MKSETSWQLLCVILKLNKESKNYKDRVSVQYMLMINIGNLGSEESLGVKFKDRICAELSLKL